jgi:hypothetical protein
MSDLRCSSRRANIRLVNFWFSPSAPGHARTVPAVWKSPKQRLPAKGICMGLGGVSERTNRNLAVD